MRAGRGFARPLPFGYVYLWASTARMRESFRPYPLCPDGRRHRKPPNVWVNSRIVSTVRTADGG